MDLLLKTYNAIPSSEVLWRIHTTRLFHGREIIFSLFISSIIKLETVNQNIYTLEIECKDRGLATNRNVTLMRKYFHECYFAR